YFYGYEGSPYLKTYLDNNPVSKEPDNSWFLIKKLKLICNSIPVLKFKYRIDRSFNPLALNPGDSMIVEVSKDNRVTWNTIYKLDSSNHPFTIDYQDKILSLADYKNEVVNIRFQYFSDTLTTSINYRLDDIEVGELDLHFTDISYDDILQPSDAQSIKVTPSIVTPPKSKGFEDYDMVMDFYVKEDSTGTSYALMYTDSLLENGVFEYPNWNTSSFHNEAFIIRAVAKTKSDNTTLTSTEVRVEISGRQCHVTYPPSRYDSSTFFDVELPLTIDGYIVAEPAFRDTLDADIVLVGGYIWDYQQGLWTYDYADSNYCNPNAYIYSLAKEGDKPVFEYKETDTDYIPKRIKFDRVKPTISEQREIKSTNSNVEITKEHFQYNNLPELQGLNDYYTTIEIESKLTTKDMVVYDTIYYEHATSLNLFPGLYYAEGGAFYKYDLWEQIAAYDYNKFVIPNWKLKLKEDPWYPGAVPHNSLREYAQDDDVYIEIWRPFSEGSYNIVDITITRDEDSFVVATFQVDYNTKGKRYVEWATDGTTEPGFYTITATEQFETTSYTVHQKETIQICPLYEHWEHSGSWSDIWEINTDTDYFKLNNISSSNAGIGSYSLGAAYETETGETINQNMKNDGIILDLEYDAIFEVFMGLPYDGSNFEETYADYKFWLSEDNGVSWTTIRQANVTDYTPYSWAPIPGYKFINWWTPIKNKHETKDIMIKFESYNTTAPQDTISQQVCYDEIQIRYRKDPVPDGGQNFAGNTDGSQVDLSWDAPVTKGLSPTLYYIYRNGSDLAVTASTSYTDYSITEDTMYNYSVVAYYEDSETGAWDVSSMLDCSVDIFVSSLTTPANVSITENATNVTITWDTVAGASSYKVYSSVDPYGTFTEDTTGSFNGEEWVAPMTVNKLFYYVVATDVSKIIVTKSKRNRKESK
ncbi:MAG: hypothetical protein GQ534_12335, partial [Candidatus Delongbacteria bacterium]|nr:hypothetical protein [Candidatus Delongbacteria bacterium]